MVFFSKSSFHLRLWLYVSKFFILKLTGPTSFFRLLTLSQYSLGCLFIISSYHSDWPFLLDTLHHRIYQTLPRYASIFVIGEGLTCVEFITISLTDVIFELGFMQSREVNLASMAEIY